MGFCGSKDCGRASSCKPKGVSGLKQLPRPLTLRVKYESDSDNQKGSPNRGLEAGAERAPVCGGGGREGGALRDPLLLSPASVPNAGGGGARLGGFHMGWEGLKAQ